MQCQDDPVSCGRCIERNPLEAGVVAEPSDDNWSSARANAWGVANPLVTESAEYHDLASEATERRRTFLLGEDPFGVMIG